ncbi:MAG: hypothetical protein IT210_12635 [Armatimonadetes bacterium]|nr:hypothetical protein [Armatimonadota bacterium]
MEWTLYFKNSGTGDTPVIEDIRPMDFSLRRVAAGEFRLHWNTADNCSPDSYQPHEDVMGPGAEFQSASADGRPTTGRYP